MPMPEQNKARPGQKAKPGEEAKIERLTRQVRFMDTVKQRQTRSSIFVYYFYSFTRTTASAPRTLVMRVVCSIDRNLTAPDGLAVLYYAYTTVTVVQQW